MSMGAHHGQKARASVLPDEVLICKTAAVDAQAASAISLQSSASSLNPVSDTIHGLR